jgi:23S rRNA pseudouridine1911/1915/1917 synthase
VQFIANQPERLDKFLSRMLPKHSRTKLVKLIDEEKVSVNGKPPKPSFILTPGDRVEVASEPEETPVHNLEPVAMDLEIVYEDDDLLVVNKPRGLATHPASSLKEPSLARGVLSTGSAAFRPGIVHRLDKDTTGLLIVAKTDAAHAKLAKQIAERTTERRYVAVVQGHLDEEVFKVDAPIGRDRHNRLKMAIDPKGKSAVTHVRRLGRSDVGEVVVVRLETGRTHQIRVHLRAIGHPVIGDPLYGQLKTTLPLQLHAAYLSFDHPTTGKRMTMFVAPPADFVGGDLATEGVMAV